MRNHVPMYYIGHTSDKYKNNNKFKLVYIYTTYTPSMVDLVFYLFFLLFAHGLLGIIMVRHHFISYTICLIILSW